MTQSNRVEFARKCFTKNRQIAEENLAQLRAYARDMRNFRHRRTDASTIKRIILYPLYLWQKRKVVSVMQETRWKVRFYSKVETNLKHGDLGSAIEALSLFAPREETTTETIRRIQSSPATVQTILRSPGVLRENMLHLRDDLLEIQREQSC